MSPPQPTAAVLPSKRHWAHHGHLSAAIAECCLPDAMAGASDALPLLVLVLLRVRLRFRRRESAKL